jgi:hypothetical protein
MDSGGFHYDDAQWAKIAGIVERAGVVGALEKLNNHRSDFEERVAQYKDRIERWTGVGYDGVDLRPRYKKIAKASADLKAAVSEVNFFEDSEWWGWLTDAQQEWVENFKWTLDYVHRTARGRARMTVNGTKQRDSFISYLALFWELDLGLTRHRTGNSRMGGFIEAACNGVCDLGKKPRATITNALQGDEKRVAQRRGIKIPAK